MRKTVLLISLAGALAAAPSLASADPYYVDGYYGHGDCWGHRVAGTVLGGLGGGAIGAAAAAGVAVTPWAWAAAGVGALIGHAIGVASCHHHWDHADYDDYGPPPPPPRPYPYAGYRYGRGYYDAGYDDYPPPPPPPRYYYQPAPRYYEQPAPQYYEQPAPQPAPQYQPAPYAPPPRG